ncbi:MAG: glutamine-hydrolyzing GMP synthase [Nitrospinota bacterium]|nr:MAG: glutamine-hydrolyzing GMP synthase [Nitrospinota bacterium]
MSQIVVLNAGGQYCHLIARRIRDMGVYTEIKEIDTPWEALAGVRGIIISGGPHSVYAPASPTMDRRLFSLGVPILGICYGHQLLAQVLGGKVTPGEVKEYGLAHLAVQQRETILEGLDACETVWMSHSDVVETPPPAFKVLASTPDCPVAAMANPQARIYGLQFHPEVVHTVSGQQILRNFVFTICRCQSDWDPKQTIPRLLATIREKGERKKVFFLISGGVDSTVAFTLCVKALGGDRVVGLYVDTGFMRQGETEMLQETFRRLGILDSVHILDASAEFIAALHGVYEPEEKRVRIGRKFLEVQERSLQQIYQPGEEWLVGQGTIYPDTIESGGSAHAAVIKTHHNRVDIVQELMQQGKILEPLVEFYKDEVREIGLQLGLPPAIVWRHPFPGPGLAIRCLCSREEAPLRFPADLSSLCQTYGMEGALAPLKTVGVQGDYRSYTDLVLISGQGSLEKLEDVSTDITNTIPTVNRVAYLVQARQGKRLRDMRVIRAEVTRARLDLLRQADRMVNEFLQEHDWQSRIWQCPVVLLPLRIEVGESIALRPVSSLDGMTAEYAKLPGPLVIQLAHRLLTLPGIDAVFYDVTNKPPATIEWE